MKIIILLLICMVAIHAQQLIVKTSILYPRVDQTCYNGNESPLIQGWFWDSDTGHCEYCAENCFKCSSYQNCETCKENYGKYQEDLSGVKVNKCKRCGDTGSLVKECCWNDINDAWGFHAIKGKCAANAVQFGHYCMESIPNCVKYSPNSLSDQKDSTGYTRCVKCADGYYLDENYQCTECYHIDWDQMISKQKGNKIPIAGKDRIDFDVVKDYKHATLSSTCNKCHGPAQCSDCKRGYFMATNNYRETFDRNISRNPSQCRQCNKEDEIHTSADKLNGCACTCSQAEQSCIKCNSLVGEQRCWKDPDKSYGCRPCKEIKFKYYDANQAILTIDLGQYCQQCSYDSATDPLNNGMKCTVCVEQAVAIPFFNINAKKDWGFLCVEGRAANTETEFVSNPSIIKSADNSISSPKALMLKYNPKPDKTAQTIEFERYDVLTSATGIPDSYKASYISQKSYFTIPNCGKVRSEAVYNIQVKNGANIENTKYPVYYPECIDCDNGYTDVIQDYILTDKTMSVSYVQKSIKVCRKCSEAIKERDEKYLSTVSSRENYKYVRRCKTIDQTAVQYDITQCAYDSDQTEDNYPLDNAKEVDGKENYYRGPNTWNYFKGGTDKYTTFTKQMYLVKAGDNISYQQMTFCIKNINQCKKIKPYVTAKTGAEGLADIYTQTVTFPACNDCYTNANSGYYFVKTQKETCKVCPTTNLFDGCTDCAPITTTGTDQKSDDLYCTKCQNNLIVTDLYRLKPQGFPWEFEYETSIDRKFKNYYSVSQQDIVGKVTCKMCDQDRLCQKCHEETDKQGKCETCQPFYRLDSTDTLGVRCEKCFRGAEDGVPHCYRCDTDRKGCDKCRDGYYLLTLKNQKLVCEKCEDNCLTCAQAGQSRKVCTKCVAGNYLNQATGTCQKKRRGCSGVRYSEQNGDCEICQYGYTLINGGWCYDCMRQNYNRDEESKPENPLNTQKGFLQYFGFIHCPWSKNCNAEPLMQQYTNIRRYPTRLRILDLLDEIFE